MTLEQPDDVTQPEPATLRNSTKPSLPQNRGDQIGRQDRPLKSVAELSVKSSGSAQHSKLSISAQTIDDAGYGVRLVGPDGRMDLEIPLQSRDVVSAMHEICFHSLHRTGYELWREGRLILGVF